MLWFIYTTIKGNKLELIKEKSTFIYDGKGISKEELNLIVKHDYFLTVNGNYCNVRRDFDEVNVYRLYVNVVTLPYLNSAYIKFPDRFYYYFETEDLQLSLYIILQELASKI